MSTLTDSTPAPVLSLLVPLPLAQQAALAVLPACATDDVTPVIVGAQFALPAARPDGAPDDHAHRLTLTATDRYRVHRFTFPKLQPLAYADGDADDASPSLAFDHVDETPAAPNLGLWLPRTAVEWLAKLAPKSGPLAAKFGRELATARVRFTWDVEVSDTSTLSPALNSVLVEVESLGKVQLSQRFEIASPRGNFPPVARFLPSAHAEAIPSGLWSINPKFLADVVPYLRKYAGKEAPLRMATVTETDSGKPSPVAFRAGGHPGDNLAGLDGVVQPNLILGTPAGVSW